MTDSQAPETLQDPGLLYMSSVDVEALGLTPADLRGAIGDAVRRRSQDIRGGLKTRVQVDETRFFMSMSDADTVLGLGVTKWIGYSAANAQRGLPAISAQIILSDADTARPVAIMDGSWITTHRTAALSALAAQALARPGASTLGVLGCGVQAHSNLAALADVLPGLRKVRAFSRSTASAEALADRARDMGFEAEVMQDPEALAGTSDVVVSCLPSIDGITPIVRSQALKPGALAIGVDLGRAWQRDGLSDHVDGFFTDDLAALERNGGNPSLAHQGRYDGDLYAMLSGAHPGRESDTQRLMFLFPGMPLADLAVARLVMTRAAERGLGTSLMR
ncbi:ornithine cyclodeaminase [Salipiger thiooxidans]|uniref:Ornithine cyclodeaminase n=1 Tax=Salipiger thiooxidans TaxID=282683 RepID=A0A1G7M8J5_9RHOB|nr:ornithine cyclodeaminase family protein [Salipiger thiooxidans]SDF58041.1 ornithine cyclodeaminase [Salipiger thiooxidans]